MVKIHIEIEGGTSTEALADLRHLAEALTPTAEITTFPVPLPSDPAADPVPEKPAKATRKSKAAAKTAEAPADPTTPPAAPEAATVSAPTPATPAAAATTAENTPAAAPTAPAEAPAAPVVPTPAPVAPVAPTAPVAAPETKIITMDDLAVAGSGLIDRGKMADVMSLLSKYGVQAITQLKESVYPAFAADLRALGAVI